MKGFAYLIPLFVMFICTAYKYQTNSPLPGKIIQDNFYDPASSNNLITMKGGRANFSGNWKLNVSKSKTGRYGVGDKTCLNWLSASKSLEIAFDPDYLTVDLATSVNNGTPFPRQETLKFDGKEHEVSFLGTIAKKSTVRWSNDKQTMYVSSIINYPGLEIKTSEVWKLIDNGNALFIQSNSNSGENIMNLVYEKAN